MRYNLKNEIEVKQFKSKCNYLIENKKKVDLTMVRNMASRSQSNYMHLLFSWYGANFGYTKEEVKQDIFKRNVCSDFFLKEKNGVVVCRSSKDLNTLEMTQAIEKFRNHSSEMGCYLPEPNEKEMLNWIEDRIKSYGLREFL